MTPSDPIALTQHLVRIASVNPSYDPASPGELEIAAWLEQWGREQKLDTSSHEALDGRRNVVFTVRNGADHPHLLLNGHTDTVGVQGMTIPPFGGEVSNGKLHGRGSSDMKGAVACMLAAMLRLRGDPTSWRGTVTVGCVVDEEFRGRGIYKLLDQMNRPDFAVVGEPTQMSVVRGCKGCLRFVMRARGRAAHSSDPSQGRSAIVAMADAILVLDRFFKEQLGRHELPEFGKSTGSVGLIEGGSGINVVAEQCEMAIDIRLIPGQDGQQTYRELQDYVRQHARRVGDIEWTFGEPTHLESPMNSAPDAELVKVACDLSKQAGGPSVVPYGCDGSKIAAAGIPCIIIGPGNIAQAHTADEAIALEQLTFATDYYTDLAKALMPPTNA